MMFRSVSVKAGEEFEVEGFGGGGGGFNNDPPADDGAPAEGGDAPAWGAEPAEGGEGGEPQAEGNAWGEEPQATEEKPEATGTWGDAPDASMDAQIEPKPSSDGAAWGDSGAAAEGNADWGTGGGDGDGAGEGTGVVAEEPAEDMREVPNLRDGPVDECTIYYADLTALRLQGILSLDNYYHLKVIPQEALGDVHLVINCFKTIIKKNKSMDLGDAGEFFEKATRIQIEEIFPDAHSELPQMFKQLEEFDIKDDIVTIKRDTDLDADLAKAYGRYYATDNDRKTRTDPAERKSRREANAKKVTDVIMLD